MGLYDKWQSIGLYDISWDSMAIHGTLKCCKSNKITVKHGNLTFTWTANNNFTYLLHVFMTCTSICAHVGSVVLILSGVKSAESYLEEVNFCTSLSISCKVILCISKVIVYLVILCISQSVSMATICLCLGQMLSTTLNVTSHNPIWTHSLLLQYLPMASSLSFILQWKILV